MIKNKYSILAGLLLVLTLASSCGKQAMKINVDDISDLQEVLNVSFEDYWIAKKNMVDYIQKKWEATAENFTDSGQGEFTQYLEESRKRLLEYSEEEARMDYIRSAVVTQKAIDLGYDKDVFRIDKFVPAELHLNNDIPYEVEYYERIIKEATRKGIDLESYVNAVILPLYIIGGAEMFLQNYFIQNHYDKNMSSGLDEQKKATVISKEYNKYVEQLVNEAIVAES